MFLKAGPHLRTRTNSAVRVHLIPTRCTLGAQKPANAVKCVRRWFRAFANAIHRLNSDAFTAIYGA